MVDKKQYPMPLGVNTTVLNKKLPSDVIEEFGLLVPDEYYVIVFEKDHSYGPLKMNSAGGQINYLGEWLYYWYRCFTAEDYAILEQIIYQIDWTKVIFPFFSRIATDVGSNGGEWWGIPTDLLEGSVYYVAVIYLLLNDYSALVKLGAQSSLVMQLKQRIPTIEQNYIGRMEAEYRDSYITEENATEWDKMWMAYFGFQFYNPPALPSEPATPSSDSSAIMLLSPFVYTNGGIGVKGSFVRMSVVGSDTVAISSTSSGTKPLSEMAIYNGDASIWGGTLFFSNQNHMQVIGSALSSGWVYCSDAVVQAYKLLKVGKRDMFGANLQSSPVGAVLSRSYLDDLGRLCIRNVNALSLLQLGFISIQGGFQGPNIYIFSLPV